MEASPQRQWLYSIQPITPMEKGTRIGPYEILRPLGAGAMGEVFEAHDHRLNRSVALKVVSASVSWNEEFIRRFEQEGQLLAQVNHPNIVSLFDLVNHDGSLILVTEFLEGATLRGRLTGFPLPPREAMDIGHQVALGLAAAHDKGLIHRDLKPENIFLTSDGRAKLLDFGLAKLMHPNGAAPLVKREGEEATMPSGSGFTAVGTPCYMSPEQASGDPLDARSDIFSFGIILWEMLTGFRPFPGEGLDVLYAIARQDAPDFPRNIRIPWAVLVVLKRCLARNPAQRIHSAHDLAFALESAPPPDRAQGVPDGSGQTFGRRQILGMAGAGLGLSGVVGAMGWAWGRKGGRIQPSFTQLTFGHGTIGRARFVPGEKSVAYSATWQGQASSIYTLYGDAPEARDLGIPGAHLLAVSSAQEVILAEATTLFGGDLLGRAGAVALGGSAIRPLSGATIAADYSADGTRMALAIQERLSRYRIEYPLGTTVYHSPLILKLLRVGAGRLAFFETEARSTDQGWITVLPEGGKPARLAHVKGITGLCWSPDRRDVWYSAWWSGESSLWAVDMNGSRRLLLRHGGRFVLQDVDAQGRVLATVSNIQRSVFGMAPAARQAQDLGWYDGNSSKGISADGSQVLLAKVGDWAGIDGPLYLRPIAGGAALRLGRGFMDAALSPDGRWAATLQPGEPLTLSLLPTGTESPKKIPLAGLTFVIGLQFSRDGNRMVMVGTPAGKEDSALFTVDLASGGLRQVSAFGSNYFLGQDPLTPDGLSLAYNSAAALFDSIPFQRGLVIAPLEGGAEREIQGVLPNEAILRWTSDSRGLLVFNRNTLPTSIHHVDPVTGLRRLVRTLTLPDPAGVRGIQSIKATPDAATLAFNFRRELSDLFLIEGLK